MTVDYKYTTIIIALLNIYWAYKQSICHPQGPWDVCEWYYPIAISVFIWLLISVTKLLKKAWGDAFGEQ